MCESECQTVSSGSVGQNFETDSFEESALNMRNRELKGKLDEANRILQVRSQRLADAVPWQVPRVHITHGRFDSPFLDVGVGNCCCGRYDL